MDSGLFSRGFDGGIHATDSICPAISANRPRCVDRASRGTNVWHNRECLQPALEMLRLRAESYRHGH